MPRNYVFSFSRIIMYNNFSKSCSPSCEASGLLLSPRTASSLCSPLWIYVPLSYSSFSFLLCISFSLSYAVSFFSLLLLSTISSLQTHYSFAFFFTCVYVFLPSFLFLNFYCSCLLYKTRSLPKLFSKLWVQLFPFEKCDAGSLMKPNSANAIRLLQQFLLISWYWTTRVI